MLLTSSIFACIAATAPTPDQQDRLQLRPERELPAFVRENERRIDPAADEWRSETLYDTAKPQLNSFLRDLTTGDPIALTTLAEDFWCSVLRPPLVLVHDDGVVRIHEARELPPERHDRAQLARLAQEFRAAAPSGSVLGTFVLKLVSVELGDANCFRMRAFLHTSASASGEVLQWNLELESYWRVLGSDEEVELSGIELLRYQEVAGPGALLPDFSQSVFGATPGWEQQVLLGTTAWTARVDRSFGRAYIGSQGLAVGDLDGDGRDDLYFCQPGGQPNRLWLRRAGGAAEEASARMGVDFLDKTRSAVIADFDNDGHQDIAISIGQDVAMCWNDGKGRFETMRVRGTGGEEIYSMAAADADGDGLLDLYACRNATGGLLKAVPHPYHDANNGAPNQFWRNQGGRRLAIATGPFGFDHNNSRFSLAAVWEDFDDDGDADLYVVNDFGRNNLYLNTGGRFRDVAAERGAEDLSPGMGATVADADADGDLDIYVTNMFSSAGRRIATQSDRFMGGSNADVHQLYQRHARGNSLLINDGDAHFTDAGNDSGAGVGLWGWGSLFFELDNDGLPDVYAPNGFLTNPDNTDL